MLACGLLLFLLPIKKLSSGGHTNLDLGVVLTFALAPMIIGKSLSALKRGPTLIVIMVAAIASGPLVAYFTAQGVGRALNFTAGRELMFFSVWALCVLVVAIRARPLMSTRAIAVTYASGLLVQSFLNRAAWQGNGWKYALAWPTAVLVLAFADRGGARWKIPVALAVLGAISLLRDYRSFLGFCLISGVVWGWRERAQERLERRHAYRALAIVSVVGLSTYLIGAHLAADGSLGPKIQARTVAQTAHGGNASLLSSARPEWGATKALFLERPVGFGVGVVPSLGDVQLASTGLAANGLTSSDAYVSDYLFAGQVELHSVGADLWVNFGPFGLLLALLLFVMIAVGLGRMATGRHLDCMLLLIGIVALWDLPFSPIGSNVHEVLLAAVLLTPTIRTSARERA